MGPRLGLTNGGPLTGWRRATRACLALAIAAALSVHAGEAAEAFLDGQAFKSAEEMIPMRDGVRLHTVVCTPERSSGRLPILFLRTPYGVDGRAASLQSSFRELADDGYIFVFQDLRGKFKSEGQFVMGRPPRDSADAKAIDEGTDAYDTINWLINNVRGHNGKVGMLGVSYDGWLTVMALNEPHPALKAASPQASPADMFLGDDFHHNGAFRLSYGFEYAAMMETARGVQPFKFDRHDTFEWFLTLGPLSSANTRYFQRKIPTWNDFAGHPNYDRFWRKQAVALFLNRAKVPTLNVAGWWDQEDFYGPLKIYETWEKHDSDALSTIVVGPWNHGGWSGGIGDRLGPIKFDQPTAWQFREKIEVPFFAHYLKDRPLDLDKVLGDLPRNGKATPNGRSALPEVISFRTGANIWKLYNHWPPKAAQSRSLFLRAGGRLAFEPPQASESGEGQASFDEYISDPRRPVPYYARPISPLYSNSQWSEWLVQDQRFVHLRPDVLSYETEPLGQDLDVTGTVLARLFASTSGTDCDWIVKLIDVYPEDAPQSLAGYQLMIANDVFRARFRTSFERPQALVSGRVEEYPIDLHWIDHRFKKRHKIMVQIQSTWFPLIDRNPQTYVPNIFEASAANYQSAAQRVYRSPEQATRIELSVMPAGNPN
jgi:putative CocE/NonD family hydrolase